MEVEGARGPIRKRNSCVSNWFSPQGHRLQPDFDRIERVSDDERKEAANGARNYVGVRVTPQEVDAGRGRRRRRRRRHRIKGHAQGTVTKLPWYLSPSPRP